MTASFLIQSSVEEKHCGIPNIRDIEGGDPRLKNEEIPKTGDFFRRIL